MGKKQYGLILVLAIAVGLIGGVVSSRLFPPTIVRAKRFEVVQKGKRLAALDLGGLVLFTENGTIRCTCEKAGEWSVLPKHE